MVKLAAFKTKTEQLKLQYKPALYFMPKSPNIISCYLTKSHQYMNEADLVYRVNHKICFFTISLDMDLPTS